MEDALRGAYLALHERAGFLAYALEQLAVRRETVHQFTERVITVNLETSTGIYQSPGFLEAHVVGTEYDRHVPYCGFQHVVYAHAETSSDIRYLTILVDA